MNLTDAKQLLKKLNIYNVDVQKWIVKKINLDKNWYKAYTKIKTEFLFSLSDSIELLYYMNLSQEEIFETIMGKKIPNGISIKFKIPLFLGGELNVNNLYLCRTFPFSFNIDLFIMEQMENKEIFIPCINKKIYDPLSSSNIGGGTSNEMPNVVNNDRR